jgi:uncharacterized LabA/DUF88 family protein
MREAVNNAYIDGANLHNSIKSQRWEVDYTRLHVWLKEKYSVKHAYIFLGLIPKYKDLYTSLQESGFKLIFKEVVYDDSGKAKGNCDAELVLKVAQDTYEKAFQKAVIISSDGDYAGLVKFLKARNQAEVILSPAIEEKCSVLLKRTDVPIVYLNEKRSILEKRFK